MSTASVQDSIDTHGARYLERLFTERELSESSGPSGPDAARLAARFAAKEAVIKVLEIGDEAVSWRDVEVCRQPQGRVTVSLSGRAEDLARREGIEALSLSLTHEGDCAAAVVIAEMATSADT